MTKPIKITRENTDAIEADLAAVNGRATSFAITLCCEVIGAAADAEARLAALPKAERKGATASYVPAGPTAKSYKYAAKSTRLHMERRATGWFLALVSEDSVYPRQPEKLSVTITQAQADEIARRAVADFTIDA